MADPAPSGFSGFALKKGAASGRKGGKRPFSSLPSFEQDDKDGTGAREDETNDAKRTKLTSFGGEDGESSGRETKTEREAFVIPKQEDTFVPGVGATQQEDRRFNAERYLPERVGGDEAIDAVSRAPQEKFETNKQLDEKSGGGKSAAYGLQVRKERREKASLSSSHEATTKTKLKTKALDSSSASTSAGGGGGGGLSGLSERDLFKREVSALPEEAAATSETYERMPVEHFGKAMMRGMGWKEGLGVGRNAKKDVKVVEFLSRPDRLGLGAQPKLEVEKKKPNWINKPGEEKGGGGKKGKVLYADSDGRVRHTKHLDEKLVEYKGPGVQVGKRMLVASGKHEGLKCSVLEILPPPREKGRSRYARVKLLASEKVVDVRCKELEDLESKKSVSVAAENQSRGKHRGKDGAGSSKKSKGKSKGGSSGSERKGRRCQPWLYSNLRVRVVDKYLKHGKAYLKKAVVVDVLDPSTCDIILDDNRNRINGVSQDCLETVVPKAQGSMLLAVKGDLRGKKCKMLQRNTSEGKATVQFTSDFSVKEMHLDDICELVAEDDDAFD